MQKNYEEEFKKKIIRLHIEEGRTIKSLSLEYSISKSAVSYWLKKFRNECRINKKANEEQDFMKQNNKLKKELEELKKCSNGKLMLFEHFFISSYLLKE